LAGYRFEGNVFWLNKETANVAKNWQEKFQKSVTKTASDFSIW
jgi:hypothetical protein